MNQIQRKSPFWSLAGPLLAYLAIQWVVQTAAALLISLPYMIEAYAAMIQIGEEGAVNIQELMDAGIKAMSPAFELLLKYQLEILGASAAGTLILTVILFVKDRKLEKACGITAAAKKTASAYVLIVFLGAAGSVAVSCLTAMVQLAFYDSQYQQTSQVLYGAGLPVQLAVLGILIPVSEEMMYRGLLFKRFREKQGFWYSAVCSAVFFMFMHTNTTQMVYAFLLGLMLAYLYEKIGSLKAPVLLHILMNSGAVIFTETGVFRWLGADPVRMPGAVIGGAFVCSAVFVGIQRIVGADEAKPPTDRPDSLNMF